ncbi:MAG: FlgD immunoglobulin-like domain containing protein, partial [candidate division WOR-3 bacterium]
VILEDAGTEHCFSPGIAVTPGDIIHVSWERGQRVYYRECRNGQWSERVRISTEPPLPLTEPASNPSIEAYGDYVYCAWRGPNENGEFPGDIWRRARWLTNPPGVWYLPENQSKTPNQESDYPVMSTKFATVWQESIVGNNWDIWARFESEPSSQPIFRTIRPSRFPHIDGYWHPAIGMFRCHTILTEKLSPFLYEVKFGRYDYIPTSSVDASYYSIEVGRNNPSPYCLSRDGYLNYGGYSVDYAHNNLKYHLPYLNPRYSYFLRAVVYRRGQNTWIEEFKSDTSILATISSEPNIPETVWIEIPREKYEKDARILYEIEKEIGNFATIADLRLYQVEIFAESGSGGGQSAGNLLNKRPTLHKPSPNPFRNQTAICYQLPQRGKVFITVYDASGRMVRELLNGDKEAGFYTISWDGRDERGNFLPAGVYFYRLKADKFMDIKRAVLIR